MTNDPNARSGPGLAIVTVSYNSGGYLEKFLESTHRASGDHDDVLVVVADNRSDDAESARSTTLAAGATFIDVGSNAGYGAAVNHAVSLLPPSVQMVLVSNPDVVLSPGSLDVLLEKARSDARNAAVGPAVLETNGEVYPSARDVPSLRNGLGHALFANVWPRNPWTQRYHREGEHEVARTTGWLSGACLLVRRDVFDSLGGFDTGFFMYFEDVDLGWRIGRAGYRSIYEPAARVWHVGGHTTRDSSHLMRREHHRSAYRFLSRKYSAPWLLPLRVTLRAALAVRARLHG